MGAREAVEALPAFVGSAMDVGRAGTSTETATRYVRLVDVLAILDAADPAQPTTGPDGDGLVHTRAGRLVHVTEGVATALPRGESMRLALEVLVHGAASPDAIDAMRLRAETLVDDEDTTVVGLAKDLRSACAEVARLCLLQGAAVGAWLAWCADGNDRLLMPLCAAVSKMHPNASRIDKDHAPTRGQ